MAAAVPHGCYKTFRKKLGDEYLMRLCLETGCEVTGEYPPTDMSNIYTACVFVYHRRMLKLPKPAGWTDSDFYMHSAFANKGEWDNFFVVFKNTGQNLKPNTSPMVGIPVNIAKFGKTLWLKFGRMKSEILNDVMPNWIKMTSKNGVPTSGCNLAATTEKLRVHYYNEWQTTNEKGEHVYDKRPIEQAGSKEKDGKTGYPFVPGCWWETFCILGPPAGEAADEVFMAHVCTQPAKLSGTADFPLALQSTLSSNTEQNSQKKGGRTEQRLKLGNQSQSSINSSTPNTPQAMSHIKVFQARCKEREAVLVRLTKLLELTAKDSPDFTSLQNEYMAELRKPIVTLDQCMGLEDSCKQLFPSPTVSTAVHFCADFGNVTPRVTLGDPLSSSAAELFTTANLKDGTEKTAGVLQRLVPLDNADEDLGEDDFSLAPRRHQSKFKHDGDQEQLRFNAGLSMYQSHDGSSGTHLYSLNDCIKMQIDFEANLERRFKVFDIPRDENCLFAAFASVLNDRDQWNAAMSGACESQATKHSQQSVRKMISDCILENDGTFNGEKHSFFDVASSQMGDSSLSCQDYCDSILCSRYGGKLEISAFCLKFQFEVILIDVLQKDGKLYTVDPVVDSFVDVCTLYLQITKSPGQDHYRVVMPKAECFFNQDFSIVPPDKIQAARTALERCQINHKETCIAVEAIYQKNGYIQNDAHQSIVAACFGNRELAKIALQQAQKDLDNMIFHEATAAETTRVADDNEAQVVVQAKAPVVTKPQAKASVQATIEATEASVIVFECNLSFDDYKAWLQCVHGFRVMFAQPKGACLFEATLLCIQELVLSSAGDSYKPLPMLTLVFSNWKSLTVTAFRQFILSYMRSTLTCSFQSIQNSYYDSFEDIILDEGKTCGIMDYALRDSAKDPELFETTDAFFDLMSPESAYCNLSCLLAITVVLDIQVHVWVRGQDLPEIYGSRASQHYISLIKSDRIAHYDGLMWLNPQRHVFDARTAFNKVQEEKDSRDKAFQKIRAKEARDLKEKLDHDKQVTLLAETNRAIQAAKASGTASKKKAAHQDQTSGPASTVAASDSAKPAGIATVSNAAMAPAVFIAVDAAVQVAAPPEPTSATPTTPAPPQPTSASPTTQAPVVETATTPGPASTVAASDSAKPAGITTVSNAAMAPAVFIAVDAAVQVAAPPEPTSATPTTPAPPQPTSASPTTQAPVVETATTACQPSTSAKAAVPLSISSASLPAAAAVTAAAGIEPQGPEALARQYLASIRNQLLKWKTEYVVKVISEQEGRGLYNLVDIQKNQPVHCYGGDRVFYRIGDRSDWVREGSNNAHKQLNGDILFRPLQVQKLFEKYPQLDRSLSQNGLKFHTTHAVQLGVHHPKKYKDFVAIDGYPMCDPCLDDEDDVERMALAQCDSPASTNMIPVWVYDPDLPYDEVEKIKHCVCIMYATKFIPAGSRLSWYYPMVHHKSPAKLPEKPGFLRTPEYKPRKRGLFVNQYQMKVAGAKTTEFDPLCVCRPNASQCLLGNCWGYNREVTGKRTKIIKASNRSISPNLSSKAGYTPLLNIVSEKTAKRHRENVENSRQQHGLVDKQNKKGIVPESRRLPTCKCSTPCTNIFLCTTPPEPRAKINGFK